MPYAYAAGDYYQAGGLRRGNYGAGGIFSFIGKAAKAVGGVIGGPIGGALGLVGGALAPTPAANTPIPVLPPFPTIGGSQVPTPKQRAGGVTAVGVSPLGTVGVAFRRHRHMNAGNAKAAHRAIRRIKAVRHLLQGIERELPHQRPRLHHGSPGVITRAEAARALRH